MFSGCLVTKDSGSADFGDPGLGRNYHLDLKIWRLQQ